MHMRRSFVRTVGLAATGALVAGLVGVVAASPAGATVSVTDDVSFRMAFANANETHIDLGNDVDLTCGQSSGVPATRNSSTSLTVDGHGFRLRQLCPASEVLS